MPKNNESRPTEAFRKWLNERAPFKCRWLAFNKRTPLTNNQLAEKSGLSRDRIKVLARAETWDGHELDTILRFMDACGVDPLHWKPHQQKLRRMLTNPRGPVHLKTPQRRYWNSLFIGDKNWRQIQRK